MPMTMEPNRLQELARMLYGVTFPTPLPRLLPYSEAPAADGLDTLLASYCEEESGAVIYYNPDGDFNVLPNIGNDYIAYRHTPKGLFCGMSLGEYSFAATILHELGHWKQAQAGITNAIGTTLHEYHNIVLHENKFPGRKRLVYSPPGSVQTSKTATAVAASVSPSISDRITALDTHTLPRVFIATFCGDIDKTNKDANGEFVYKKSPKYVAVKDILKTLNDGTYSVQEKMEFLSHLLVEYAGSDQTALKTVCEAIANTNKIMENSDKLNFTQRRIAKHFTKKTPEKVVTDQFGAQSRQQRDLLTQFLTEPTSQPEQVIISLATTQKFAKKQNLK